MNRTTTYICHFCEKEFDVNLNGLPNPHIDCCNDIGLPMCFECYKIMINETF